MNALKKIYRSILRISWYIGGQKDHTDSGMSVPVGGFISQDAAFIFPENVTLGENALIMSGARLICAGMPPYLEARGAITVGAGTIIREGAILQAYGGRIELGSDCTVNAYCVIQGNGGVKIGNNVLIAAHVCIFSANHVFSDPDRPIRSQGETREGVEIGSDVWIGAGAKILDSVWIGRGAVVAAGAVVTRDVPEFTVVGGVPARIMRKRGSP